MFSFQEREQDGVVVSAFTKRSQQSPGSIQFELHNLYAKWCTGSIWPLWSRLNKFISTSTLRFHVNFNLGNQAKPCYWKKQKNQCTWT